EKFWIKHQPLLLAKGYQLRPRYRQGLDPPSFRVVCPKFHQRENVLDAIRISDGCKVVLRKILTWTPELDIVRYLNNPDLLESPQNRTVRLLDVITLPDSEVMLVVIPFLRLFDSPVFRHLQEVVECMRQYFEGLQFMHSHRIAHRDACKYNMMMDATNVIPHDFHFTFDGTVNGSFASRTRWRDRCSVAPVKYYFIDFGLSDYYEEGLELARDVGILGQDKTVPELSDTLPYNPFQVDIYQLGNVFIDLSKKHPSISPHFGALLEAMTRVDPNERPTAAHVVTMFEDACSHISAKELEAVMDNIPQSPYYSGESDLEHELTSDSDSDSDIFEDACSQISSDRA
ncbi:hypothetical protein C8F01DRAFT_1340619, partial [Mycena amicta]